MITIYNEKFGYKIDRITEEELDILKENNIPINFKKNLAIYIKDREVYFKAIELIKRSN